jgi:hypothetical protein
LKLDLASYAGRYADAECYCSGMFTHAATSGLLAGTGLRQVADRSVGMIAALRLGPQ